MDGPLLCRGHFSCISQEFGSHCPSPWLFFSALVERRTSQYESEQTCRRQEAAGAIQKCKRWSWTVYSICDAYDAEHVFHSCFRRGYHLDEGECDHAGCVYSSAAASEIQTDDPVTIPTAPTPMNGEDVVTLDGGSAAGVIPPETQPWAAPSAPNPVVSSPVGAKPVSEGSALTGVITTATHTASTTPTAPSPGTVREGAGVPSSPPTFRNVEIGGGRITGHEVAPDGQSEREFAMYSTEQYMAPTGPYDTVETIDGSSWYRQYAQPTVEKTPYKDGDDKIRYEERIVPQMPPVPKRKDKV